jgi:hypothetical protein
MTEWLVPSLAVPAKYRPFWDAPSVPTINFPLTLTLPLADRVAVLTCFELERSSFELERSSFELERSFFELERSSFELERSSFELSFELERSSFELDLSRSCSARSSCCSFC